MSRKRGLSTVAAEAALVLVTVGLMFAAGFAGWAIGHAHRQGGGTSAAASASPAAVSPAVADGAHTFVQFACSQCHGPQGRGGVSPDVPALTSVASLTVAQLSHIIDHGLGESANPKKPYMPVWGAVISTTQVSDLVAYIKAGLPAVSQTDPVPVPQGQGPAVTGSALYIRYGCINCHGPNGLGGVPNPLSEDKAIPPLSGGGFRHDFPTDKAIADVIRSGSVIGKAPIVSMPHWGGIIPPADVAALTAYLKTLK